MRFYIPKLLQNLYFFSVPLFIIHVMEEFVTLYYPQFFGITYRQSNLPMDKFLTIEAFAITGMLIGAYLIKNRLIPLPFLMFPGAIYFFQLEHVIHTIKIQSYYPGLFTGTLLFLFGLYYWKQLLEAIHKRDNLFS